jgi:hypothetical protein
LGVLDDFGSSFTTDIKDANILTQNHSFEIGDFMAKKAATKPRWQDPKYIVGVAIGFMIIFATIISAFLPNITTTVDTTLATPEPFRSATPTPFIVPSPEPDGPQLSLNSQPSYQINGLFQVTAPLGWTPFNSTFETNVAMARLSFRNTERISVMEALLRYGVNYPSLQAVSDELMTTDFFRSAWADYDGFTETLRLIEGERIIINFNLNCATQLSRLAG